MALSNSRRRRVSHRPGIWVIACTCCGLGKLAFSWMAATLRHVHTSAGCRWSGACMRARAQRSMSANAVCAVSWFKRRASEYCSVRVTICFLSARYGPAWLWSSCTNPGRSCCLFRIFEKIFLQWPWPAKSEAHFSTKDFWGVSGSNLSETYDSFRLCTWCRKLATSRCSCLQDDLLKDPIFITSRAMVSSLWPASLVC